MVDLDRRDFRRGRVEEIRKRAREEIPILVVRELLVEHGADPLRDRTDHLPLDHGRIDDGAAVLDGDDALDPHLSRFRVDLGDDGDTGVRVRLRRVVAPRRDERRVDVIGARAEVCGRGDLADREALARRAPDGDMAIHKLEVLGRRLEQVRGDAQELLANVTGRAHRGAAADDSGPAAVASRRVRRRSRISLDDLDVLEVDAQLVGSDLRERRLVPLPVRLETGRERHRPVGLHRHADGVEVAEAGEAVRSGRRAGPGALLDEGAEADAEKAPLRPQLALARAQVLVAEQVHGAAHRLGEAAAVVVAPGRRAVGGAIRDRVAQPQLDRVDCERARRVVDQRLARRLPGCPADAAVRSRRALVRERRVDDVADVADVVHTRQERGGTQRVDQARPRMGEVRPSVAHVAALEREEAAVRVGREREVADDLLGVAARGERLVAVLHPLHRRAQAARELGDDHLLDEQLDLQAEAAPDVGADHPHPRVLQPEQRCEHAAHEEGHLRGRPHGQRSLAGVPVGDHAPAFERRRVAAAEVEALAEDVRGAGERRIDVARLEFDVREVVSAEVVVQHRRPRRERRFRIDDRRERLVVDLDQLGRVLGDVARARDDDRDRLADVAHAVDGQHAPDAGLRLRPGGDRRGERREIEQILAGDDERDTLEGACSRGVDSDDPGMGIRAAVEGDMERAGRLDVVEVRSPAREEARVLGAHHSGADVTAGHPASSRRARAARCTASTMPT